MVLMGMRITSLPVFANLHYNSGVGTFFLRIVRETPPRLAPDPVIAARIARARRRGLNNVSVQDLGDDYESFSTNKKQTSSNRRASTQRQCGARPGRKKPGGGMTNKNNQRRRDGEDEYYDNPDRGPGGFIKVQDWSEGMHLGSRQGRFQFLSNRIFQRLDVLDSDLP
ncbi:unnamed protein product [Amoebophrya sp. A120]|nr:unnamed protein product [Amoebophrya sp. A120]|eukprot:GSA120T00018841001.1